MPTRIVGISQPSDSSDNTEVTRLERQCDVRRGGCGAWGNWVSHFATFPEALVEPCIKAGTSERGACRFCGAPWERVVSTREKSNAGWDAREGAHAECSCPEESTAEQLALLRKQAREEAGRYVNEVRTIGWRPTCRCIGQHGKTRPCVVLDPFAGSGTVGLVARRYLRDVVLIELNADYVRMAQWRMEQDMPLFAPCPAILRPDAVRSISAGGSNERDRTTSKHRKHANL